MRLHFDYFGAHERATFTIPTSPNLPLYKSAVRCSRLVVADFLIADGKPQLQDIYDVKPSLLSSPIFPLPTLDKEIKAIPLIQGLAPYELTFSFRPSRNPILQIPPLAPRGQQSPSACKPQVCLLSTPKQ